MKSSKILEKVVILFEDTLRKIGDDVNEILENDYSYEAENFFVETLNSELQSLKLSQEDLLRLFLQDWSSFLVVEDTLNGADMISQNIVIGRLLDTKSVHKILSENPEILSDGWGWPNRFLSNENCDEKALVILAEALIESGNDEYLEKVINHSNATEAIVNRFSD